MHYITVSLGIVINFHHYDPFDLSCIPTGTPCSQRLIYQKYPILYLLLVDLGLPTTEDTFAFC